MVDLAQDIKPISYLKAHTAEVVNYVSNSQSPVVVTQNGEAKAVIIDINSYQKTLNAVNLAKLISISEKDLQAGKIVNHESAKKRFEKTINQQSS
jgi:prevent-host-death family protein